MVLKSDSLSGGWREHAAHIYSLHLGCCKFSDLPTNLHVLRNWSITM